MADRQSSTVIVVEQRSVIGMLLSALVPFLVIFSLGGYVGKNHDMMSWKWLGYGFLCFLLYVAIVYFIYCIFKN